MMVWMISYNLNKDETMSQTVNKTYKNVHFRFNSKNSKSLISQNLDITLNSGTKRYLFLIKNSKLKKLLTSHTLLSYPKIP